MPAIVEMRLRPSRALKPTTRQLHGLACAVFEGAGSAGHLGAGQAVHRLAAAAAPDGWLLRAAWLHAGLPHSVLAACGQLRLGPMTCAVTDLALRPASHADLASGPPLRRGAADLPLPDLLLPERDSRRPARPPAHRRLVAPPLERLAVPQRPPAIGDDQWREIHQALRLADFDLRTQARDAGHGHDQGGFTGTATSASTRTRPSPSAVSFGILARFAEFCGTGAQTTHGFGATSLSHDHGHQPSESR